ncbi:hypothetical protein RHMOL_Rhmol03G0186900 [Rhododendron molle]|uniref:Uncharacterized protein n=1 Tax=Rhododendron molle TaxID=49168 RepID=A0ACC0PID8_RHOML|nr:hypothetical protein RHMOL_Rhmol03G0186900 [Rhododendron molle]
MAYSSEIGSWKASGEPLAAKYKTQYDAGVYWNGAVNWFNSWGIGDSVYYNVDDERLGNIPLPPIPEGKDWQNREFRHYGESWGHLHLVEAYDGTHRVDVYELERDYSGWFSKFSIDLDAVGVPRDNPFGILCVVRMERDEQSLLVLHVHVIAFNWRTALAIVSSPYSEEVKSGGVLTALLERNNAIDVATRCPTIRSRRTHLRPDHGKLFAVDFYKYDNSGVYWNGAVHWFNSWRNRDSLYYNVGEERMGFIPAPPARELRNCYGRDSMHYGEFWGRCSGPESSYYGESGGHLHLVETYRFGLTNQVDVYEMARDYSVVGEIPG